MMLVMKGESGFIKLGLIILAVIAAFLWVTGRLTRESAESLEDTTNSSIQEAQQNVDKANQAGQQAGQIVEDINELIENPR